MKICGECYRETKDEDMALNVSGEKSLICGTCSQMLGKGAGYASYFTDKEIEDWFKGTGDRREKYKEITA